MLSTNTENGKFNLKQGALMLFLLIILISTLISGKPTRAAASESFPNKNITWIVPFGPGGGYDVYSRAIARVLPRYLPKETDIVIRNIPGAGTMKATTIIHRSRPDGYTMGILDIQALSCLKALGKSKINPKDFTYLVNITRDPGTFMVAANSPFKTLEDLQKAEIVKFGVSGPPSLSWIGPVLGKKILNKMEALGIL